MTPNAYISIKSTQISNGESETTEFFTECSLIPKNEKIYIRYDDSELLETKKSSVVLKFGENSLTIIRSGDIVSQLFLSPGCRKSGIYATAHGEFTITIDTKKYISTVTETGGILKCRYSIEINSAFVIENELDMEIKIKETLK